MKDQYKIPAKTRIGHIHLKVSDLKRALDFYCGLLGFELTQKYGEDAAFISAGGYHHHIGLNTWESAGGPPPPPGTTGLYHVAFRYPTRAALATVIPMRARVESRSLALTGKGHATDRAILLGLSGERPDGIDPDEAETTVARIRERGRLHLGGTHDIRFDEARDLRFNQRERLPHHSNGMRFTATIFCGSSAARPVNSTRISGTGP